MKCSDYYDEIFGRVNSDGNVMLLYVEAGESVTMLDTKIHPVGSEFSCRYEHPEGLVLSRLDAESLGVEIEE